MRHLAIVVSLLLLTAPAITAQESTKHTVYPLAGGATFEVELPPLTLTGSTLATNVTYDPARQVYRYEYTINSAATNRASIRAVQIDISGRVARPQTDPALNENVTRVGADQPATTIPVGITVPTTASFWSGGVGAGGRVFFSTNRDGAGVLPGASLGGFVIESKLPPGVRNAEIRPSTEVWRTILRTHPEGELDPPADSRDYSLKITTVAPSDPDLSQLFNGGGQSPAEVNPFLRYVAPTDTRTKLPAGTSSTWVVVAFGTTTDPASFTATFNGVDVRSRFTPVPGALQAVQFELQPGSNKLQLSIEGVTSSGRTARDTDTLTFLVQ
ncbi:MAG TPA: hypothetical protein VF618_12170 [Thermoanaerobaculia bacterium]